MSPKIGGLAGITMLCLLSTMAFALPSSMTVDFRDAAWTLANNQHSYAVGTVAASAFLDDIDALLSQDTTDGLGVNSAGIPEVPNTPDIDYHEILRVDFTGGMNLAGAWVTNLFSYPDLTPNGEFGWVEFYDAGDVWLGMAEFYGDNSDQANGEQFVSFGGIPAVIPPIFQVRFFADFPAPGLNEYSVAGFDSVAPPVTPVPAPGAVLLAGMGMGLVSWLKRRNTL